MWMKVFLKYCGSQRPVLLFVDGHASHVNLDVIDLARKNYVILYCLPPHTTHALQPLDVSVFKSLKSHFSKAANALSFAKDFVVSKREFACVVKTPFERAFSISNIKAGFAKCGIHLFDPDTIDQSKITQPLEGSSSSTDDSSGAASSSASFDTSFASPGSDSQIPSVNSSPNVSSLFSHVNGYSPPQVPSGSPLTSTPTTSTASVSLSQPLTPASSHGQQASTSLSQPHVQNSLVRAGLLPERLADILSPQADNATEKRSRRITGVKVLMSNEYTEMMRVKDRREKEKAEMKQTRKEERKQKRLEKEQEQERGRERSGK